MSPIKNLTDTVTPRFPRLGKLHKGGEKVNGQYGPDLDHFRFTSTDPEIVTAFEVAYGREPHTIQVYLPNATPEEAFVTWAEIWSATGLTHRCDGETMSVWLEKDKYIRGSKPCAGGHENGDYLNDAIGRLDVIVPELVEAGFVGYVTLETHSKHDILNILAVLQAVYNSRGDNPLGLRGILFNLRRVQESVSTPGFGKQAGKRSRVDKWLVRLEPVADWVRLQLEMASATQMALPAPDEEQPAPAATTPAPQQPAPSNGGKPPDEVDVLGQKLWLDKWPACKAKVLEAKKDLGVFVRGRDQQIKFPNGLADHVKIVWPGMEALVPGLLADASKPSPYEVIRACRHAWAIKAAKPALTTEQLLAVAISELAIPAEFA